MSYVAGLMFLNTAECGLFKIISSVGVASGVRRIEAICGIKAIRVFTEIAKCIKII